jgi:hypothetical protein
MNPPAKRGPDPSRRPPHDQTHLDAILAAWAYRYAGRITSLVPTAAPHDVACGQRVRSPHAQCGARWAPFRAAERTVRRWAVIVRCHCGTAWREEPGP